MNSLAAAAAASADAAASLVTSASKEKEPFKVRPELYAPTRLAPSAFAVLRLRALVVDVLAHESLLLVLLAARSVLTASTLRTSELRKSAAAAPETHLPRVGILGGGHVGSAVALALLRHNYPSERLAISTRQPERVPKCDVLQVPQAQALYHSVPKYYDNARLARESDVLVLCMPPSQLKSVAIQLKHALSVSDAPTLVVSALCGVSRELLHKACGSKLVARVKVGVAELGGGSSAPPSRVAEGEDATISGGGSGPAGVGNASSVVEIAARELAHDGEQLAEVLTDLGLRSCLAAAAAAGELNDPESLAVLEDAIWQQMRSCLGCSFSTEDKEAEAAPPQLTELASEWISDWDAVLAVIRSRWQQQRGEARKISRVGA